MAQDQDNLTALERLVREGTEADLRRFLLLLQPPEIADLIESLRTAEDRARTFKAIVGREDRADVLREVDDTADVAAIVVDLPIAEAADLLEEMQSDDAADVLQTLEEDHKEEVLREIEAAERAGLRKILSYPEDSAGGIMQTELVRVRNDRHARAAVQEIRRTRDEVGELHEVFVVDEQGRLCGWLKERDLILADDMTPIHAITSPIPASVPVTMDQEKIAALVKDYDLSSIPVVDENQQLVGRILVDDIVDVIEEEATEDITRMVGSTPDEIYEPSVAQALRSRSPWLFSTFLGGLLAAGIINWGNDLIQQASRLVIFIPVIMGMGGGCATQTATVTVRSLALGRIDLEGVRDVVMKEVLVGMVLAAGAGVLIWISSHIFDVPADVAWIAALAIFGTVSLGTLFGVVTPLLLHKLGVDPAVATHPLVTTANDILGSSLIILFCWMMFF
jgi:magnesium transporter